MHIAAERAGAVEHDQGEVTSTIPVQCLPSLYGTTPYQHRFRHRHSVDSPARENAESIGVRAHRMITRREGNLMNDSRTTHTGSLGSVIHVLRADPETIVELARVDWNRHFRRVCLDPVRGLITLMAPSHLHEDLTTILDHVVDVAGSAVAGAAKGLLSTRLRGRDEPPGTGMEPDCAFYVGERARRYYTARGESQAAVEAFVERVAPDLVVETEISNFDEGKIERYGDIGVRELWRLYGRKGSETLAADFIALSAGTAPRKLDASEVLDGLTPEDICEAVKRVRVSQTHAERTEAVSRIVLRRQRAIVRVREEEGRYCAPPLAAAPDSPAH